MKIAGKVWGSTAEIFSTGFFEVHALAIRGGHRCSRHRHTAKTSELAVMRGAINVTVWQPSGTVDVTELLPGQSIRIPPGVDHQFEGVAAESEVLEAYWAELHADDIIRVDTGE